MTVLVRTVARGHLLKSEDGETPHLNDGDNHTYVWCDTCSEAVCIHDPISQIAPFFVAECEAYEPELPGMEAPIIEIPRYAVA